MSPRSLRVHVVTVRLQASYSRCALRQSLLASVCLSSLTLPLDYSPAPQVSVTQPASTARAYSRMFQHGFWEYRGYRLRGNESSRIWGFLSMQNLNPPSKRAFKHSGALHSQNKYHFCDFILTFIYFAVKSPIKRLREVVLEARGA